MSNNVVTFYQTMLPNAINEAAINCVVDVVVVQFINSEFYCCFVVVVGFIAFLCTWSVPTY